MVGVMLSYDVGVVRVVFVSRNYYVTLPAAKYLNCIEGFACSDCCTFAYEEQVRDTPHLTRLLSYPCETVCESRSGREQGGLSTRPRGAYSIYF